MTNEEVIIYCEECIKLYKDALPPKYDNVDRWFRNRHTGRHGDLKHIIIIINDMIKNYIRYWEFRIKQYEDIIKEIKSKEV